MNTKIRIGVVGCRNFNNYEFIKNYINRFLNKNNTIHEDVIIVSGGAKGVDTLAERYAIEYNIPIDIYKAEWNNFNHPCKIKHNENGKYNALAGFNRNKDIVKNSDIILAFWDGKSKGTENTIMVADDLNKNCIIIELPNIENTSK